MWILVYFFLVKVKKVLFKAETDINHVHKTIDNSSQKCILSSLFYHILKSVTSLKFTKKFKSSLKLCWFVCLALDSVCRTIHRMTFIVISLQETSSSVRLTNECSRSSPAYGLSNKKSSKLVICASTIGLKRSLGFILWPYAFKGLAFLGVVGHVWRMTLLDNNLGGWDILKLAQFRLFTGR